MINRRSPKSSRPSRKMPGGGRIFVGPKHSPIPNPVDVVICSDDDSEEVEDISNYSNVEHPSQQSPLDVIVLSSTDEDEDEPAVDVLTDPIVEESKVTEYFVIVDLEATCFEDRSIPRDELEIIEIGAALLEKETLTVIDKFSVFCKPVIHEELSSFCKDLTHISQSDVDDAAKFPKAFKEFTDWMDSYPGHKTLCSWGAYDKRKLISTCETYQIKYPFDKDHLNVKEFFSSAKGYKRKYGLSNAMKKLKLEFRGIHHRGVDDAANIAEVLAHLLSLPNKS